MCRRRRYQDVRATLYARSETRDGSNRECSRENTRSKVAAFNLWPCCVDGSDRWSADRGDRSRGRRSVGVTTPRSNGHRAVAIGKCEGNNRRRHELVLSQAASCQEVPEHYCVIARVSCLSATMDIAMRCTRDGRILPNIAMVTRRSSGLQIGCEARA